MQTSLSAASVSGERLDELDLARVVDVMKRDAGDLAQRRPFCGCHERSREAGFGKARDGLPQQAVLLFQEIFFGAPRLFVGVLAQKPVAPFDREASPLPRQTAADQVLPVGGMNDELADVVSSRCGAPRRL